MSRLLVCVLLVYLSSAQVPDIRYWNRNGLQWSDFRCQVPAQAKDTLAVSYVGIDYRMHAVEDSFYYSVVPQFRRDLSWARVKTVYNLQHEQLHFDLAEYMARRIRKSLMASQVNYHTYRQTEQEVKHLLDSLQYWQDRYDRETQFGRQTELQIYWNDSVHKILEKESAFTDTLIRKNSRLD